MSFALGVLAALVASVLFNVGVALQALEARSAPKKLSLRLSLVTHLLRRWRWVLGLVLGVVGVGPQVFALSHAPFVVVQPALAAGLLLLLYIGARYLGERVSRSAWMGVAAIIAGLALLSWGAPSHTETHRNGLAVIAVVGALVVSALAPFPVRGTRFDSPMLLIVASGCGFGATNVATKLFSDDIGRSHWVPVIGWVVVGLAMGVAATITGMTAFQVRPAAIVVPISTSVQTFLPIALEPLFLRERWSSAVLDGVPIAAGLLVALLGTVLLSRTGAVSELAAAGA